MWVSTWATSSSGTAEAGITGLVLSQLLPDLPRIAALTILPLTRMPPDGDAVEPATVVDGRFAVPAEVTVLGDPHRLKCKSEPLLNPPAMCVNK